MKSVIRVWLLFGMVAMGWATPGQAAAEAWLPGNTLMVLRIPDATNARGLWAENPWRQLWRDPAMARFRARFLAQLDKEWLAAPAPGHQLRLSDALDLARGELLLAVIPPVRGPLALDTLEFLLMTDVGDQTDCVRHLLTPAPPPIPTAAESGTAPPEPVAPPADVSPAAVSIEGVDFFPADLRRPISLLGSARVDSAGSSRGWAGLDGSWLFLGTDPQYLARVIQRMRAGAADRPSAAPPRSPERSGTSPGSTLSGWLDLRPWLQQALVLADAADRERNPDDEVPMPKWRDMLEATGLPGVRTLDWMVRESLPGTLIEVNLTVPRSARRGLFEMLALQRLDASPPPDVAADVMRFERIRLDFDRGWRTLERTLTELFPQLSGVLDLLFQTAGPAGQGGDLRNTLLPVLGNDIVRYELAPRSVGLESLLDPPSLLRVRSTNSVQLAISLRALTVLLPPPLNEVAFERIADREVYSVVLPHFSLLGASSATPRPVWFTALDDGVGFTSDRNLLAPLLASNSPARPALRDQPRLAAAAQQVGGMDQGWFAYHDLSQSMRATFALLRQEPGALQQLLDRSLLAPPPQSAAGRLLSGIDLRLLPPFDEVAHYFPFLVQATGTDADRFYSRWHMPRPGH